MAKAIKLPIQSETHIWFSLSVPKSFLFWSFAGSTKFVHPLKPNTYEKAVYAFRSYRRSMVPDFSSTSGNRNRSHYRLKKGGLFPPFYVRQARVLAIGCKSRMHFAAGSISQEQGCPSRGGI